MSKKSKLDLRGLKVQSFVTSIGDDQKTNLKGGTFGGTCDCPTAYLRCNTWGWWCPQSRDCPAPTEVYENTCGNGCSVNWC